MELQEVIRKRRTVRDFSSAKVPPEIIEKAILSGLNAPSHNNLKQWDFILIKNPAVRKRLIEPEQMAETVADELIELFANINPETKDMYMEAIPKQKSMILEASELLAVVYAPKTHVRHSKRTYDLNCLAAVWCCIDNILLSLAEDDVFAVTFVPRYTERVKEILEIPAHLEVAALIPCGYKAENAHVSPQKEVCVSEKLHINKW